MQSVLSIKGTCGNNILDEESIRCLLKSEEDIENGRTRKAAEVIKEFKEKYGLLQ